MVHWAQKDGRWLLMFTRDHDDPAVQAKFEADAVIANQMILIVGVPGSGKSVFANNLAHKFQNQDYTVIYISEKPNAPFDNAFCMFPQENGVLLDQLKQRYMVLPYTREQCFKLAKLYHPFTFNIPDEKLPPIKFYSLPLHNLDNQSLGAFFKGDMEAEAFEAVKNGLMHLPRDKGFYSLVYNIGEEIGSSKYKSKEKVDQFFQELSMEGSERTRQRITTAFRPFVEHYLLHPATSPHNLDFVHLLNDNKAMHFFSTNWIDDAKVEKILIIMILESILAALKTGKVKKRICIVMEEIKVLLPQEYKQEYDKVLSKVATKLLSTIRTYASVIATTQEYFKTDENMAGSFMERFFGIIAPEDLDKLVQKFGLTNDKRNALLRLGTGQFIRLRDLLSPDPIIGQNPLPPFSFQNEDLNFFQKFAKEYPELLQTYKPLKTEMKALLKVEEQESKSRYDHKKEQRKAEEERQRKLEEMEDKKEMLDKQKASPKQKQKMDVWNYGQQLMLKTPGKAHPNWKQLARKFGISDKTAKDYFYEIDALQNATTSEEVPEEQNDETEDSLE